jgi:hypothetical protein
LLLAVLKFPIHQVGRGPGVSGVCSNARPSAETPGAKASGDAEQTMTDALDTEAPRAPSAMGSGGVASGVSAPSHQSLHSLIPVKFACGPQVESGWGDVSILKGEMMATQSSRAGTNKALVVRALTDPAFRRLLAEQPAKALGVAKLSAVKEREVKIVLAVVKGIDRQIANLADELLCANGGPCGIA